MTFTGQVYLFFSALITFGNTKLCMHNPHGHPVSLGGLLAILTDLLRLRFVGAVAARNSVRSSHSQSQRIFSMIRTWTHDLPMAWWLSLIDEMSHLHLFIPIIMTQQSSLMAIMSCFRVHTFWFAGTSYSPEIKNFVKWIAHLFGARYV